jgi:DNA-directed RNA polymerase specialized sigma subunit, sigma24 homolog
MLRINNDYSLEEIADALKVSVPAAKARLYRAQHRLKMFFPGHGRRDPQRSPALNITPMIALRPASGIFGLAGFALFLSQRYFPMIIEQAQGFQTIN